MKIQVWYAFHTSASVPRFAITLTCYRAPKPWNPKSALWSPKNAIWTPWKMVDQNVKKCQFWTFYFHKMDFLDTLIDFWGPFSRGPQWHFSDLKMRFWGFGVPGLCSGSGRLQAKVVTTLTSKLSPWLIAWQIMSLAFSELQTHLNLHSLVWVGQKAVIPSERVQIWVCLFLLWLVLSRCDATNLGVFDLCHFAPLKQGCANSGGFGAPWKVWTESSFWCCNPGFSATESAEVRRKLVSNPGCTVVFYVVNKHGTVSTSLAT